MTRFEEWQAGSTLTGALPWAVFDEIACGLIVCDGDGTLRFVNQAARQELAEARLLQREGQRLRRCARVSGDLEAALAAAAVRGRRTLLRLEAADDRLMATVLPLHLPQQPEPTVLVMLGRRQPCGALELEMLAGCYGLTGAERRVLAGLVREATPREIADENAVKLSTVRTQISAIRNKLGAKSIDGLLLRAAEVPPVASALRMTVNTAYANAA